MIGKREFERIARDFYRLGGALEGLTQGQLVELVIGNAPFERYPALLEHLDEVLTADVPTVAEALFQAGAEYYWTDPRAARDLVAEMRTLVATALADGRAVRPDLRAMGLLPPLPERSR